MKPLATEEIETSLHGLDGWTYDEERRGIRRRIQFADFNEALGAMVRIGLAAERSDHHPEWSNVYNRLDILLTTHDAGGVTSRDLSLASFIDGVVAAIGRK